MHDGERLGGVHSTTIFVGETCNSGVSKYDEPLHIGHDHYNFSYKPWHMVLRLKSMHETPHCPVKKHSGRLYAYLKHSLRF